MEQRFLILSSIKYLISPTEYDVSDSVVKDIVAQHQEEKIWGFGEDQFPIGNGHEANGVFEHPPSARIAYKTTIDPIRPIFAGILSIKDAAQSRSDGAGFTLEIEDSGEIQPLFHVNLNPRDVPADRAGHPFRVDLSKFAGQDVKLLFSTDPGPSGNNAFDWAGWTRLQFEPEDIASTVKASPFKPIYDREVFIYEIAGVLPRAALYSAAEVVPDDQVLARLKAPDFDPQQKVIISRESISPDDETAISSFSAAPGSPVHAAEITVYQPEHVQIEAETDAPALLMLNDTDYPGWQATVNGTRVPIMQADYLFRGVMVPTGKSTVEFDYEPRSFRLGAEISAASLFGVIALPLVFLRRNQNPKVNG
jgi:membrane protein YfhO